MPDLSPQPQTAAQQMDRFKESLRSLSLAYTRAWSDIQQSMRPLVDLHERHPELFEQVGQEDAEPGACHCLCGTHREQAVDVCRGEAGPGLMFTFHSSLDGVGTQHVDMCRPCHEAQTLRAADRELARAANPLAYSPDAVIVTFDKP